MDERSSFDLREPLLNPVGGAQSQEEDQWHFEESTREAAEEKPTPLPKTQLSVLMYLEMAEPMTTTIIRPFIVKLVKETGITGGDFTKVGYYTGLVESSYYFTQALMILQWGRISDRIGRRPVILMGLFALAISMLCFGLSHAFLAVVASRAIAGALDGNMALLKCVMSEITDDTNRAHGFAFIPITWAVGNSIGPLLGGLLQHPYERFGGFFEHIFWKNNPYFLPCLVSLSYSISAFLLAYFFLKETAPYVVATKYAKDFGARHNTSDTTPLVSQQSKTPTISLRDLLTPRVTVVILNYGLTALVDMAFTAIQPLFLSIPIIDGGLGMSPSTIGVYMAAFGISKGIVSVCFFTSLERRFGTRKVFTTCVSAFAVNFALYPIMNALAKTEGRLGLSVRLILIFQLALATLPPMAFSCVYVYIAAASPSRAALGATTGLAQTTRAIVRAFTLAGASALFSLSMEHNLLGGSLVYVVFCAFSVCAAAASTLLPPRPWRRAED